MEKVSEIRPSPIAGTWYSGNSRQLSQQVDDYIKQAKLPELNGEVVALVVPHAGHRYSGPTAGHAFRSVLGQHYDLVGVVSPLHSYSPLPVLTSAHKAYSTPLGSVPIDLAVLEELNQSLANDGVEMAAVANDHEHSLEIELPFLQRALQGGFTLLPVMLHSNSEELGRSLGKALAQVLRGRSALLVASSDLSHFYPVDTANALDGEMLRQIAAFSPEGVLNAENTGTGSACGALPVAAVLWAARELGANAVEVVHHSTSGDETGDFSSVVGYGAAVILKRP